MGKSIYNFIFGEQLNAGFSSSRNPTVDGFNPVRKSELNFLDVTNDGLKIGKSPNDDRFNFLKNIIKEIKELVQAHGDSPKETWIEQLCATFIYGDEE